MQGVVRLVPNTARIGVHVNRRNVLVQPCSLAKNQLKSRDVLSVRPREFVNWPSDDIFYMLPHSAITIHTKTGVSWENMATVFCSSLHLEVESISPPLWLPLANRSDNVQVSQPRPQEALQLLTFPSWNAPAPVWGSPIFLTDDRPMERQMPRWQPLPEYQPCAWGHLTPQASCQGQQLYEWAMASVAQMSTAQVENDDQLSSGFKPLSLGWFVTQQ